MSDTERPSGQELKPVPDPTTLTTQQLIREIAASRETIEIHTNGIKQIIETRLDGMDKAISLIQLQRDKMPDQILAAMKQLQELHEEKFSSIATQFRERDTRTEQTSKDSKVAVDAALQAAKEAVGEQNKSNALAIAKSEATFTKQIDQIGVLVTTMQRGIDDKIDDIKSRLQVMEGTKTGASSVWGVVLAIVGVVAAIAGVVVAAVAISTTHHP